MPMRCEVVRELAQDAKCFDRPVAIVIPAYNEAAHIGKLLERCYAVEPAFVVVVNDASKDATAEVLEREIPTVIVDRTSFCEGPLDRVVVQTVPDWIYTGSYPCWLLSRPRFLAFMSRRHRLVSQFGCAHGPDLTRVQAGLLGMIFDRV